MPSLLLLHCLSDSVLPADSLSPKTEKSVLEYLTTGEGQGYKPDAHRAVHCTVGGCLQRPDFIQAVLTKHAWPEPTPPFMVLSTILW